MRRAMAEPASRPSALWLKSARVAAYWGSTSLTCGFARCGIASSAMPVFRLGTFTSKRALLDIQSCQVSSEPEYHEALDKNGVQEFSVSVMSDDSLAAGKKHTAMQGTGVPSGT